MTTYRNGAFVHDRAICDGAGIGARTRVWQFASVIRNAVVGEDCTIGANAIVDAAKIGDRCLIGHAASVHPGVEIGNDVFVGPSVVFCNDRWPRASKEGFDASKLLSGEIVTTKVEDGASVGAGAVVIPGVVIGADAMIAAGAVVDRDVPKCHIFKRDGTMALIEPGRPVRRIVEAQA